MIGPTPPTTDATPTDEDEALEEFIQATGLTFHDGHNETTPERKIEIARAAAEARWARWRERRERRERDV